MLSKINPTETSSWSSLKTHFDSFKDKTLRQLFQSEPERFERMTYEVGDLFLDFSKNLIDRKAIEMLGELTLEMDLDGARKALFAGEKINGTENRAVLHTALRNLSGGAVHVDGRDVMPDVKNELTKIESFTKKLHSGQVMGHRGKKITDIVNIGIGGSDLGPKMVIQALKPFWVPGIKTHFASNVDASDILDILDKVNYKTVLFIIASKTFTTQETMTNANTAREWFLTHGGHPEDIKDHFVAVSTNTDKVTEFGIDTENMFEFWDWVGGRYSLWSSIGLSIACGVGYKNFEALLLGAEEMDKHFFNEHFKDNVPVQMALIGIWYNNFFGAESIGILPYDQLLVHFSKYLQQGDMESNGKYVSRNGEKVSHQTGPIIWGEPGTNGQHAFYQLIHQGTKMIPCDFIASAQPAHSEQDHHEKLLSNFFAQTEALMNGKSEDEARKELEDKGLSEDEVNTLLPFKVFEGNRPTTSILLKKLTPKSLGNLIALYEHKIFVQGVIWNIFSFDQWGVELGKQLANKILPEIKESKVKESHDPSTSGLLNKYFELRKTD